MGKGDKQHGNREAKKPKANKKLAPASTTFLKQALRHRQAAGETRRQINRTGVSIPGDAFDEMDRSGTRAGRLYR